MDDFGGTRGNWVCPTDRQLSLRAKLKTGWSVKTSQINSFTKPEQIKESEQEAIIKVIQRADNLERVEQERVGRLVERLDNMKKNAMGNGTTQCILCADEFGFLGASPLSCNDCRKAVCTKCGVDTVSASKEPVWLCKICAETRETWKKSGAWFYKGLPKYILPAKKPEYQSKYSSGGGVSSTNKFPAEHNTPSPARSYNAWLQNKGRSNSDKEYTDSSDDEPRTMRLTRKPTDRRYLSDSVENADSVPNSAVSQQQLPVPKITQGPISPRHAVKSPSYAFVVDNNSDIRTPENMPSYTREAEQDVYKVNSKSASKAADYSYNPTSPRRYKSRVEHTEEELTEQRFRGHTKMDSISNSGSFTRNKVQTANSSQSISGQNQHQDQNAFDKRPSSLDVTSPESTSKKYRQKILRKLKMK